MLNQNILDESAPYRVFVSSMGGFLAHRHADIELAYCLKGEFDVILGRRRYTVGEGELLLIPPMLPHEIPSSYAPGRRVLTAVLGPALLRDEFSAFTEATLPSPVLRPEELPGDSGELLAALHTAADRAASVSPSDRLALLSALFCIASRLAAALPAGKPDEGGDLCGRLGVEPALELIRHGYRAPLTVEDAAAATGYSKSNFCKIFRTVTGETFHRALNRRRIRAARDLLRSTPLPISLIAAEVGIPEPKTFARVFKEVEGCSPHTYRLSRV